MNATTAFWINGKQTGELRTSRLSPPNEGEVQVRTLYSGISRGTETLVFNGEVPDSEYVRMRAPFQEGEFPFPVKYGYINVGIVERGPAELTGKHVFCLYPHQTLFNVHAHAVTRLPANIPPERAVLAANMETAVNALWDAQPSIGDRISVVGAGVLGSLVAYLASRMTGCEVQLIDVNTGRASLAESLGVAFREPRNACANRDLVVHASATSEGLESALSLAGFEATVLELSWFGSHRTSINLGGAFHSQRLQIKCSQVGHIAPNQRARWSYARRLQLALSLLADPCLDALISGESAFSSLPETLQWLCAADNTSLCHRISYE